MKFPGTWVDMETVIFSDVSQTQKEMLHVLSFVDVSFEFPDMCVPFEISMEVRKG